VIAHALHTEGRVAQFNRFENREMLVMIELARAKDAEDQPLLVGEQLVEHVEELREHGVAARRAISR